VILTPRCAAKIFWKDDETLRPIKKNVFRNIEWLLAFWTFIRTKYTFTLQLKDNFFSLNRPGVSKIRLFMLISKKYIVPLKKVHPKKVYLRETEFSGKFSIGKIV
jgi:hypothetical protein